MTSEGAELKAQQPSKPDLERSYDVHLARLESERKHQNDVFGWFLGLNGFLFAALGFAWKDAPALIFVIGALGLVSAASWWVGSWLTALQMRKLRYKMIDGAAPDEKDPWLLVSADIPPSMQLLTQYLQPTTALPVLLGLAWAAVIIIGIATH
jgi:hypothetical protein